MALASRHAENIGGVPVRRFGHTYPFFGLSVADRAALDKKGGNLLSLSLFKSLLTTPNVRVFHAHALKRLGGTVRTAARLRRKPFVVSLHGGVFDVPEAERGEMLKPIANKTEWGTTPISPPSSLRRGYDRQAGPTQWLFHGPPAESKLLATTCQPRVKPTGSSILATNSPAKSARES